MFYDRVDVLWFEKYLWSIYICWVVCFRTIGQNKIQHSNRWYIYKWFYFLYFLRLLRNVHLNWFSTLSSMWVLIGVDWFCCNTGYMLINHLPCDAFETAVSSASGSISKVSFSEPFLQQHRPPGSASTSQETQHSIPQFCFPRKKVPSLKLI